MCRELAALADFEYFYEGLLEFAAAKNNLSEQLVEELRDADGAFRKSIYLLGKRKSEKG